MPDALRDPLARCVPALFPVSPRIRLGLNAASFSAALESSGWLPDAAATEAYCLAASDGYPPDGGADARLLLWLDLGPDRLPQALKRLGMEGFAVCVSEWQPRLELLRRNANHKFPYSMEGAALLRERMPDLGEMVQAGIWWETAPAESLPAGRFDLIAVRGADLAASLRLAALALAGPVEQAAWQHTQTLFLNAYVSMLEQASQNLQRPGPAHPAQRGTGESE